MHIDSVSTSRIKRGMMAAAKADSLLCKEGWLCCYEYHDDWGDGFEMAKYDDGGGDHFILLFDGDRAILKGFDHESELSPYAREPFGITPGLYDGAPPELLAALQDPALEFDHVTFCFWRLNAEGGWGRGRAEVGPESEDGTDFLIPRIVVDFPGYDSYAEDYFEDDYTEEMRQKVLQIFSDEAN